MYQNFLHLSSPWIWPASTFEILRARKCVGDCRISRTRVTRDLTQLRISQPFHRHLSYIYPPQGHLLLIGVSGAGKTTLSRFVAWMNGLKVFQVKVCLLCLEFFFQLSLGFALHLPVIGLENSCQPFNQSEAILKPIGPWSLAFSRAWDGLFPSWVVICSLWHFPSFWLAVTITNPFGFWSQSTISLWLPLKVSPH